MVGDALLRCSKCNKERYFVFMQSGYMCDCHLYCVDGDNPKDCSVSEFNYSGPVNPPFGMDSSSEDNSNDLLHATGYCSVHGKYVHKVPIWLEVDWKAWQKTRMPKKLRARPW